MSTVPVVLIIIMVTTLCRVHYNGQNDTLMYAILYILIHMYTMSYVTHDTLAGAAIVVYGVSMVTVMHVEVSIE